MLTLVQKIKNVLDSVILLVLSIIIISMVGLVSWQIFSRTFLQAPSAITEELVRFSLIWLGLLGAVYGFSKKQHISIMLVFNNLPYKIRQYVQVFIYVVLIIFFGQILFWGGLKIMQVAMIQLSPTLRIPMGYVYSVLPISGILCIIYIILDIIEMTYSKGDNHV